MTSTAARTAETGPPSPQVPLLLGDGAAGRSPMDVHTLVRHDLPVVMVVGSNPGWGLEKHQMQQLYRYHVMADLAPVTRYGQVARVLGADGETVERPEDIGAALDRASTADCPSLVNVPTHPAVAHPRSATGV